MRRKEEPRAAAAADAAAASGRKIQLELEGSLVAFLEEQGMEVYEPDTAAFRNQVQSMYLDSEFAATWPAGVLEKVTHWVNNPIKFWENIKCLNSLKGSLKLQKQLLAVYWQQFF